jgi:hypothetical protein
MGRWKLAAATAVWCLSVLPAQAHFLWIAVEKETSEKGASNLGTGERALAEVWFNEAPTAGGEHLIGKVAQTHAWLRTPGARPVTLALKQQIHDHLGALVSELSASSPYSVEARCDYGVFTRGDRSQWLTYYAKHLQFDSLAKLGSLAKTESLALDLVPAAKDDGLTFTCLWQGKPAAEVEMVLVEPGGERKSLTSDKQGQVQVRPAAAGEYAVRARFVEPDRKGEKDGKVFTGALHYATLTMNLKDTLMAAATPTDAKTTLANATLDQGSDLSASELLKRARDARSVWRDFPGFESKLEVRSGGQRSEGTVKVTGEGEIELSGFPGDFEAEPVKGYLESLVQHRMADGGADESVVYAQDATPSSLGRLIAFEGDEKLHSTYRIRDDVITEVNREMGESRFSISVLDVYRNASGKYLPQSFSVSFWDKQSGALKRVDTHVNLWTHVDAFDLPRHVSLLKASSKGNQLLEFNFSEQRLLAKSPSEKKS